MANRGEHGGKRKGAGRRPKWSHNFKLHIGMLCQTQFREAQKIAENRAIKELISEEDLHTEFQKKKIYQFLSVQLGLRARQEKTILQL